MKQGTGLKTVGLRILTYGFAMCVKPYSITRVRNVRKSAAAPTTKIIESKVIKIIILIKIIRVRVPMCQLRKIRECTTRILNKEKRKLNQASGNKKLKNKDESGKLFFIKSLLKSKEVVNFIVAFGATDHIVNKSFI